MNEEDVARATRIAMFKGAVKAESFDIFSYVLREARERSKRKNTILFALSDPRFSVSGMDILVRLNAGKKYKNKRSRKMRVSSNKVNIRVNEHGVTQISVVGDVIENGSEITDKVSLGQGTEVINFISASK